MARDVNVQISASTSGFISSINNAENALNRAVNNMKTSISSLNTSTLSLNATFQSVATSSRALMGSIGSGGGFGATSTQITQLNATLDLLIQRLTNNTTALHNTSTAMGHLTTATSRATTALSSVSASASASASATSHAGSSAGGAVGGFAGLTSSVMALARGFGALYVAQKAVEVFNESKDAVVQAEMSFKSFESAVNSSGVSLGKLNPIIEKYAKNTALSRSEIEQAMSSMLKMKFTPEQIDKALGSATDLAAFGRQKGKKYGQAIVEGFEGLRMGISSNTNNMGWQENISKAEEKYAASIGKTVEKLTEEEKAQAYVASMARESAYASGDAAKAQETLSGSIDQANKFMDETKQQIGQQLIPAYEALQTVQAAFLNFTNLALQGISITVLKIKAFFQEIGAVIKLTTDGDLKAFKKSVDDINKSLDDNIKKLVTAKGYQGDFKEDSSKKVNNTKEQSPKEKYEEAKKAYDLMMAKAEEERKVKHEKYENDLLALKQQLDKKLIALSEYTAKAKALNAEAAADSQSFFDKQISGLKGLLAIGYKQEDNKNQIAITKAEGSKEADALKYERERLKIGQTTVRGGGGGSSENSASAIRKAEFELQKQIGENELNLMKTHNQTQINLSNYKFTTFKTSAKDYYAEIIKLSNDEKEKTIANINKEIEFLKEQQKQKNVGKVEQLRIAKELVALQGQLATVESNYSERIKEANRNLETYNRNLEKNRKLREFGNNKDDALQSIQLGQIQKDKDSLGGLFGNKGDSINSQKAIEEAKYQVAVKYINQRKQYLLENEKENVAEIEALDQEMTDLKRQHILELAELEKQQYLKQKEDYISLVQTQKQALQQFLDSNIKHTKSLRASFQDLGDSIQNKLLEIAEKNLIEKIFNVDAIQKFFDAFASNSTGAGTGMGILQSAGSGLMGLFGGGSGGSMLGSLGSMVMSAFTPLATGTNLVPRDMPAILHEGEAVVPKKYNNADNFGGSAKRSVSVVNNFISSAVPDKRTQHQMAMSAGNSVKLAGARK